MFLKILFLPKCGKNVKASAAFEKLIRKIKSTSENKSNKFLFTTKKEKEKFIIDLDLVLVFDDAGVVLHRVNSFAILTLLMLRLK